MDLDAHTVHVWRIPLDQPDWHIAWLTGSLSPDEREVAGRFHFVMHRNRYIAGRGAMRAILARYLGSEPSQVCFAYGAQGKPALATAPADQRLCFNLAHSQALGLLAVASDREVGIDVEGFRRLENASQVAERFFSSREVAAYREIAECNRTEAFLRCWTRKEAYLKALGTGLSTPLDRFDVSLEPDDPRILHVADSPDEVARWSMRELRPQPCYIAAVVAEGADWSLRCWHWDAAREASDRDPSHS